jgi:hypothetical protein
MANKMKPREPDIAEDSDRDIPPEHAGELASEMPHFPCRAPR